MRLRRASPRGRRRRSRSWSSSRRPHHRTPASAAAPYPARRHPPRPRRPSCSMHLRGARPRSAVCHERAARRLLRTRAGRAKPSPGTGWRSGFRLSGPIDASQITHCSQTLSYPVRRGRGSGESASNRPPSAHPASADPGPLVVFAGVGGVARTHRVLRHHLLHHVLHHRHALHALVHHHARLTIGAHH